MYNIVLLESNCGMVKCNLQDTGCGTQTLICRGRILYCTNMDNAIFKKGYVSLFVYKVMNK